MTRCGGFDTAILGLVTMERPAPIRSAWVTFECGEPLVHQSNEIDGDTRRDLIREFS